MKIHKYLFLLSIFFLLSACALGPEKRDAPAVFDLGPQRAQSAAKPVINATLLIPPVAASPLLDNANIQYRLMYQNASQPDAYAQNHWAMSPA